LAGKFENIAQFDMEQSVLSGKQTAVQEAQSRRTMMKPTDIEATQHEQQEVVFGTDQLEEASKAI
jgi:hypothetical protein